MKITEQGSKEIDNQHQKLINVDSKSNYTNLYNNLQRTKNINMN